jgi:hypothetical protein
VKILATLALFLGGGTANGVLVITDIPDDSLFGIVSDAELDIDIDGDGISDVRLEADNRAMNISSLRENVSLATFVTGGLDRGGNNAPFARGEEIGGILPDGATWFQASLEEGSSTLLSCVSIGCIGLWGGGVNYTGIQITDDEGNNRYGWIEIDAPFDTIPGGIIQKHAFETEANRSIFAVPELSSTMLLLLGTGSAFFRRKRI